MYVCCLEKIPEIIEPKGYITAKTDWAKRQWFGEVYFGIRD